MKRIAGILLFIGLLTGAAFTAQLWSAALPAAKAPAGAAGYIPAWIADVEMNGLPWSEPVSIILSSLVVLWGATMLRRRRSGRRA